MAGLFACPARWLTIRANWDRVCSGLRAVRLPFKFIAMNANLLEAAKALPLAERIDLAEALWESITDGGHEPPLTPAQAEELDRRLEEHRRNPQNGIPFDGVRP